jgi:hypothetical protein
VKILLRLLRPGENVSLTDTNQTIISVPPFIGPQGRQILLTNLDGAGGVFVDLPEAQ